MKLIGLLILMFFSTSLYSQNQIFLEDGNALTYTDLRGNGKKPTITLSTNSQSKSLPKKDILGFTNHNGALYTFNLKSGRKFKVKEKGSIDDPCFIARLHAYKYFRYKGSVPRANRDDSCYEEQTKKLRTRSTVSAVGGGVAFALSLSLLISSISQANSL